MFTFEKSGLAPVCASLCGSLFPYFPWMRCNLSRCLPQFLAMIQPKTQPNWPCLSLKLDVNRTIEDETTSPAYQPAKRRISSSNLCKGCHVSYRAKDGLVDAREDGLSEPSLVTVLRTDGDFPLNFRLERFGRPHGLVLRVCAWRSPKRVWVGAATERTIFVHGVDLICLLLYSSPCVSPL